MIVIAADHARPPVLGSPGRLVGNPIFHADIATVTGAAHEIAVVCELRLTSGAVRLCVPTTRTINSPIAAKVIPLLADGSNLLRKRRQSNTVVRLPCQDRRMAAVADDHVAMQLQFELLLLASHLCSWTAWVAEAIFSITARLNHHDAEGVGGVHKLFTLSGVPWAPEIAAHRCHLLQVAPLLLLRNTRCKAWIVVPARTSPELLKLAVDVNEILIPGDGANSQRALLGVDYHTVNADDMKNLIHIRLSVNRVVRIPQSWMIYSQRLVKELWLRICRCAWNHRLHILTARHDISIGVDDLRRQGYILGRGALVHHICLDMNRGRVVVDCVRSDIGAPGLRTRIDVLRDMNLVRDVHVHGPKDAIIGLAETERLRKARTGKPVCVTSDPHRNHIVPAELHVRRQVNDKRKESDHVGRLRSELLRRRNQRSIDVHLNSGVRAFKDDLHLIVGVLRGDGKVLAIPGHIAVQITRATAGCLVREGEKHIRRMR